MSTPTDPTLPSAWDAMKLETLQLRHEGPVLHVTLSRPASRNSMSFKMVEELAGVLESLANDLEIRVCVFRGAEGNFCAGGDIKDMAAASAAKQAEGTRDPLALANRRFGIMLERVAALPQVTIALVEGMALGGGFGLACTADLTIAVEGCTLRLPEVGLGITPAQIAPFVVERVGVVQARRLALTGQNVDAQQACRIGIAQFQVGAEDAEQALRECVRDILRGAPTATRETKALLASCAPAVGQADNTARRAEVLDHAADRFAALARGAEAMAGMTAFISKKPAPWVPT